ncbi:MAG: DUF2182 domain-containing protein [Nocardioides sp.]|nr:DUF2182 domain-containing protein [Nocardioides sp.]
MSGLLIAPAAATRKAVTVALVAITGLSWAYLVFLSMRMSDMESSFAMPMTAKWSGPDVVLMSTMWSVMMAGMMLPSAAPMISAYSRTIRSGTPGLRGSTPAFVVGYLATWSVFAMVATSAQWALHNATLVSATGASTNRWLGALLLLTAGAYQFTGAKDACLRQCRSPLGFLLNQWRNGRRGAFLMGLRHGATCVGCCWALMTMLFVLGVMNLWWVALLAAVVLLEKFIPSVRLTRVVGGLLLLWGSALMAGVVG